MRTTLGTVAALACMLTASTSFAEGDPTKGEREFRACRACHELDAGKNGVGPSLHGLFGAAAGQVDGFTYSDAMASSGIIWTAETLDAFLADPKEVVPGTTMGFRGVRRDDKRADLIAYLELATASE